MTEDERIQVVKALACSHMWGQDGVAGVFLEMLDKRLPAQPRWQLLYANHCQEAKREYVGVLDDDSRLTDYLRRGYWLTNHSDDGCSLFNPPPMNGLSMYVSKRLADKYRRPNQE